MTSFDGDNRLVSLTDGVTSYCDCGSRVDTCPIVLIHGGTLASWCFDELKSRYVAAGRRVITYDGYGRGHSDCPKVKHDIELFYRQLHELLIFLNIDKCEIIGYSLGAPVALKFVLEHAQRVVNMILIAPVRHFSHDHRFIKLIAHNVIGHIMMALVGIRRIKRRITKRLGRLPAGKTYIDSFLQQAADMSKFKRAMHSIARHMLQIDYTSLYIDVGRLNVQTTIISGKRDIDISYESTMIVVSTMPNARHIMCDDATHAIVFERPDVIYDASMCTHAPDDDIYAHVT